MKRIIYLIMLMAASVLGTVSCREKEIDADELASLSKDIQIFYASIDGAEDETKTFLNESSHLCWNHNDAVSVFTGNKSNSKYLFSGENGERSGAILFNVAGSTVSSYSKNYAVYPYSSENTVSSTGLFTVSYPREQNYVVGSFGRGANIMAALNDSPSDHNLRFKNVCGYIKLNIKGSATITAIRITGNSNEKISGKMTFQPSGSGSDMVVGSVSMLSDATKEIVLNYGEGITLDATGKDFYIAVPPVTFSSGFTVSIYDNTGKYMEKSKSSAISITSNLIQPMTSFDYTGNLGTVLPFLQDTSFGAYNADGTAIYEYTLGKDQPVVSFLSPFFDFRLLNTVESKLMAIEGIPDDAVPGDEFTSRIFSYAISGLSSHTNINLKVMRKWDHRLYLYDESSSKCYIVKTR